MIAFAFDAKYEENANECKSSHPGKLNLLGYG